MHLLIVICLRKKIRRCEKEQQRCCSKCTPQVPFVKSELLSQNERRTQSFTVWNYSENTELFLMPKHQVEMFPGSSQRKHSETMSSSFTIMLCKYRMISWLRTLFWKQILEYPPNSLMLLTTNAHRYNTFPHIIHKWFSVSQQILHLTLHTSLQPRGTNINKRNVLFSELFIVHILSYFQRIINTWLVSDPVKEAPYTSKRPHEKNRWYIKTNTSLQINGDLRKNHVASAWEGIFPLQTEEGSCGCSLCP